ncbi:MAG: hypothetical protein ACTHY4_03770 [Flavobacteriaceae bacterium]|nr:hypothetical protein [Psychroflexus sp.]
MELDLGSVLIGVLVIAIACLPFILMHRNKVQIDKKLSNLLTTYAAEHSCQIDQYDTLHHFAIGIDQTKQKIFFYKEQNENIVKQMIDLNEIKKARLLKTTSKPNKKSGERVERIGLTFEALQKNQNAIVLEFFNYDESPQVYGELQAAQKWSAEIQQNLALKKSA